MTARDQDYEWTSYQVESKKLLLGKVNVKSWRFWNGSIECIS